TRAEDDARISTEGLPPGEQPFMIGQRRVQHGHGRSKPLAKPAHELRSQTDLRHEHQRAAAEPQGALDDPQVDLSLAASRYAMQDEGTEGPERVADAPDRKTLLLVGFRAGAHGVGGQRRW